MEFRAACEDSSAGGQDATSTTAEAEVVMWHRLVIESLISWCQSLQKLQHCRIESGSVHQLQEGMRTKLRDEVNALILMSRLDEPSGQRGEYTSSGYCVQQGMDPQAVCEQTYPNLLKASTSCQKHAAMSEAGSAARAQEAASKPDPAASQTPPTAVGTSRASSPEEVPVVAVGARSRSGSGRLRLPGSLSSRGCKNQAEAEKPSSQMPQFTSTGRPRSFHRLQLRPGTCTAKGGMLTRDEAIKVVAATLHKHLGPASREPTMAA